jgi:hypothetical protein
MNALKRAGRIAAGVLPAAVLVRLGLPALAALVLLGVLVLVLICWIISNGDRSERAARLMLALHGKTSCLAPRLTVPAVPPFPLGRRHRKGIAPGMDQVPASGRPA